MTEYRTVTDAKAHLNEIIDALQAGGEQVVITKNGVPVAVLVGLEDYESVLETLNVLSEPNALKEIRSAEERVSSGDYRTGEDIRREFVDKKG